ncbi:DUF3054 family protein [Nocardioidaceae bacterium]|nr:DUF3054 family protein [Nocardioidaceae bacterium]
MRGVSSWRPALPALAADLVAVVAFAAAGRQSHEPGSAVWTVATIAWPFAVAVVAAHVALALAVPRGPAVGSVRGGAVVVATTFVVGMTLRGLSGRGLDPAFLVVALLSLVVLMVGWRLVRVLGRRRG